jgi:hypothetical protein
LVLVVCSCVCPRVVIAAPPENGEVTPLTLFVPALAR